MNWKLLFCSAISTQFFAQIVQADEPPYIMGAIGDSISAGFNAATFGDNREYSWTTGLNSNDQVLSHAKRIQRQLNGTRSIAVYNEAFVGADSTQLARQARRLLRVKPDYVTIAIGANDVCSWFDDYEQKMAQYTKTMKETIASIVLINPAVKIVLVPVPSLREMYESGARQPSCRAKWDVIKICKPLLAAERTNEEREGVYERQRELNLVIEGIAAEFPQNVRYAKAITESPIETSMISSLDCFHPNIKGQNILSELTFDPNWF